MAHVHIVQLRNFIPVVNILCNYSALQAFLKTISAWFIPFQMVRLYRQRTDLLPFMRMEEM